MGHSLAGLHLHFDCVSGCAGDMTLGALLDLGMPRGVIDEAVGKLGLGEGFEIRVEKTKRKGIVGTDVKVHVVDAHAHAHGHVHEDGHGHEDGHEHEDEHGHGDGHGHEHRGAHRHYGEIRRMIEGAGLAGGVLRRALAIFDRIAAAEARVHGVEVADVHFHEVGAIDSIVDVVGTAAGLEWLQPSSISAAVVPTGHGTITCAHGVLPVPGPATIEILKGLPTCDGGVAFEMTTPTGAAILAASATSFGPAPAMVTRAIGYGAGDHDFADRPNLLRLVVGERQATPAACLVLECNIDDMNPELYAHAEERAFAAGALDVWLTPIQMKKGRPAVKLSALVTQGKADAVASALFRETTTLGLRSYPVDRRVLARTSVTVDTPYGPIPVKVGSGPDGPLNAAPEHDACRAAANAHDIPLKDVYAAALAAYAKSQ